MSISRIVCAVCGDELIESAVDKTMVHSNTEPAGGHAPVEHKQYERGEFPGGGWRLDVIDYDTHQSASPSWAANGLRFGSKDDALQYGYDLGARWMALKMFRAVEVSTPDRQPYEAGSEDRCY